MQRRTTFIIGGLMALCVIYVLQLFSPLRLNTDSIVYLTMATSAADGQGFLAFGRTDIFPQGYPALLSVVIRAGLGHSWTFIAINLIALGVGLYCGFKLLRHRVGIDAAAGMCSLMLLSFITIKYTPQAIADIVFFATMMVALLSIARIPDATGRERVRATVLALAATAAAIYVRTLGVALLAALVWTLWHEFQIGGTVRSKIAGTRRIVLWMGVAIATAAFLFVALRSRYAVELANNYLSWGILGVIHFALISKPTEWGELILNLPHGRLPGSSSYLVWPVGFVGLVCMGRLLLRRWGSLGAIDAFLVVYILILFVYPAQQPRYWMPILLLLAWKIYEALTSIRRDRVRRVTHLLVCGYLLWYTTVGVVALAYSTRLTFSGDEFPYRYGDGTLGYTYEVAFEGTGDVEQVRSDAMKLLVRYEPRVHPRWSTVEEAVEGQKSVEFEVDR